MGSRAVRQFDLLELLPNKTDLWIDRLSAAFANINVQSGFLQLAEEAVEACPGAPLILLMAATAAVLDVRPERALALLARFSRQATSPAEHVLKAVALVQTNKTAAARALLARHGLTTWSAILRAFPGGQERLPWLMQQFNGIVDRPTPRSLGHPTEPVKRAKPNASRGRARLAEEKQQTRRRSAAQKPPPRCEAVPPKVGEIAPAPSPLPSIDLDIPITMEINLAALSAAASGHLEANGQWFCLRERLAHLSLAQGFDELLCLAHLSGFEPLWHQIETVRKVLKQFRGRVLLADEVGLGKTIEASMVLKEYVLRGMAERALVLTPASLVGQWHEELETKFGLAFATTYDPMLRTDPQAFWDQSRIVASMATARRREHAECLRARQFDLVIIDEAHHLRDRSSQSWKLVDSLNKRFLLLLSATPVQNDLVELYNLLTLLKPGIFKTLKEFRAVYMTPGQPRQPANAERLRTLMRDCMIRNTRAVVAVKLPRRYATTIKVDGAPGETQAYAELATAARSMASKADGVGRQRLVLHHLLTAAGSSPAAAASATRRIAERHGDDPLWAKLTRQWSQIERGGKEAALIELVRRNPVEKKLVFVNSRETLTHLGGRLAQAGLSYARFDGSMSGPEKDASIAKFREEVEILLCTQSGGEGRNIQFCNTLINFDVPWNPMAIEQRIGRIDRIGQEREVFVFNLVTRGTLEEQVLLLLDEKISMFELVVGEVGAIVGELEEEREFPDLVLDAWLEATEEGRLKAFDVLGRRLDDARRQHEGAKALDHKLFGEDFEAG
jgi:superfamily II DNA or RNA helicase